jgi:hypothetical protein
MRPRPAAATRAPGVLSNGRADRPWPTGGIGHVRDRRGTATRRRLLPRRRCDVDKRAKAPGLRLRNLRQHGAGPRARAPCDPEPLHLRTKRTGTTGIVPEPAGAPS